MKKVLFFTQNRWAYGSIHHGLAKELYKKGIYTNLLDWTQQYSKEEFSHLNSVYDIFVTNPEAVLSLHRNYDIPFNKIVTIAHGQWDVLLARKEADIDFYPYLKGFAVISSILQQKCIEYKLSRVPNVVRLGVHFDVLRTEPSPALVKIGYGGAKETKNFFGVEIKRGELVKQAVDNAGLSLYMHGFYNHLCMPGYYKTIDAIIMSSIEEAGGLPMMEAAAAGRLCMGTPVGYFKYNGPLGGGVVLPLHPEEFVKKATEELCMFRDNPDVYRKTCLEIQEYARDNYDWEHTINDWVELFSK